MRERESKTCDPPYQKVPIVGPDVDAYVVDARRLVVGDKILTLALSPGARVLLRPTRVGTFRTRPKYEHV